MNKGIRATLKLSLVVISVFAPFLVALGALLFLPDSAQLVTSQYALDWMWFMLLVAMMLGLYFATVYVVDEEMIAREFMELDHDHDGFITVDDARTWPELRNAFARFDADHNGRMSRLDFDAFEHAMPAH